MIKKFIILATFIVLTNCGFTPMYKNNMDNKFNIEIVNTEGDKEINKHIITYLKRHIDKNLEKIIKIKIDTSYSRKGISKDSEGKTTSFGLMAITKFEISTGEENKKIIITEKLNLNKLDDIFEQKRYETKIKKDISLLIKDKLITELIVTNDN